MTTVSDHCSISSRMFSTIAESALRNWKSLVLKRARVALKRTLSALMIAKRGDMSVMETPIRLLKSLRDQTM